MSRTRSTWLSFGLFVVLLFGVLGFVSVTVVRLDAEGVDARRRAALEENVRLALWRMESTVTPLIGRENARPANVYQAFYPARRAFTRMFTQLEEGEVRVPSPLLTERHPYIRLHFRFSQWGALASPQVPEGNMRDLAETGLLSRAEIKAATGRLADLRRLMDTAAVERALGGPVAEAPLVADQQARPQPNPQTQMSRGSVPVQQALSANEWQARSNSARQMAQFANPDNVLVKTPQAQAQASLFVSLWLDQELVLVRKVSLDGRAEVQGLWLDWPAMRAKLLAEVADLLPAARLEPAPLAESGSGQAVRRLASLPIRLVPGPMSAAPDGGLTPIQISLIVAWLFALVAALAVGLVFRATLALSERRAAFVSAVTHELRTPLTTFRMYTELLADGLVRDEGKRQQYYRTLHAEAERLDHLVQNVLSYARLEKTARAAKREDLALGEVLDRVADRLAERARQADMDLSLDEDPARRALRVRVDPEAVGRILFNLVDNAAKYAASAADRRIRIRAQAAGRFLRIGVSDSGPGIPAADAGGLFRPFSKSAEQAAVSAPGVGLGLALSRRLARRMGGDLILENKPESGAAFVLSLPLST